MGSLESSKDTIPTIDISPFFAENASEQLANEVVEAVRHACNTYGFFQIVGHGVSEEERDGILECAKRFFDLPIEEKMKLHTKNSMGKSYRGYEPAGSQIHQKGLKADTKESFSLGIEISKDDPEAGMFQMGPNLWPKSLPDDIFRTPILKYQVTSLVLAKKLLKILARGLPKEWGCSPDVLDEFAHDPATPMRLLHYPPQPAREESQYGVGDHTDFGGVTILLLQEGTTGLEVWYPTTETWIPVPAQPGAFIINIGDMMQKWTAGYYRSARHRVLTSVGNKHRYSVPWFLNGNRKFKCQALDGSGEETIAGEHIRQRIMTTVGESAKYLG